MRIFRIDFTRLLGAAGRTEAATFTGERDELVVTTVGAVQTQEAMRQDAALEVGVKFVLDELGQACTG